MLGPGLERGAAAGQGGQRQIDRDRALLAVAQDAAVKADGGTGREFGVRSVCHRATDTSGRAHPYQQSIRIAKTENFSPRL
jgi:hypothetical protein